MNATAFTACETAQDNAEERCLLVSSLFQTLSCRLRSDLFLSQSKSTLKFMGPRGQEVCN